MVFFPESVRKNTGFRTGIRQRETGANTKTLLGFFFCSGKLLPLAYSRNF